MQPRRGIGIPPAKARAQPSVTASGKAPGCDGRREVRWRVPSGWNPWPEIPCRSPSLVHEEHSRVRTPGHKAQRSLAEAPAWCTGWGRGEMALRHAQGRLYPTRRASPGPGHKPGAMVYLHAPPSGPSWTSGSPDTRPLRSPSVRGLAATGSMPSSSPSKPGQELSGEKPDPCACLLRGATVGVTATTAPTLASCGPTGNGRSVWPAAEWLVRLAWPSLARPRRTTRTALGAFLCHQLQL